jgi:NitT/TauT family transport system substrate-binding protein
MLNTASRSVRRLRGHAGLLAVAVVLAALVAAGCGSSDSGSSTQSATTASGSTSGSSSSGSTRMRVALVSAATADLPVQVADQKGFFKSQGLDVTVSTPSIPFSQLPATLGKQFDLVIGSQPDLINAATRGIDVVAVAGLQKDNPKDPGAALIVPKGSPIKSIKDIAGKSVGAPSTVGNNWSSLQCWAKKEGVDPKKIRGLEGPTPQLPDLLKQGRFDAVLLFEPLLTPLVDGGAVNLGNAYEHCFGGTEYTSMWLAQGKWAKANQQAITKFIAALDQAKKEIASDPASASQLYVKTSGLPPAAAKRTPIIADEFVFEQGAPLVSDMQQWIRLLKDLGTYKGDVDANSLVLQSG